jgi:hypothetical protein
VTLYVNNSNPTTNALLLRNLECAPDVFVGAAVRFENGIVTLALADSIANSNVLGIVEEIIGNLALVRTDGISKSIYSGLDESREYFLSDTVPGGITSDVPVLAGHIALKIGTPVGNTRLYVQKGVRVIRS